MHLKVKKKKKQKNEKKDVVYLYHTEVNTVNLEILRLSQYYLQ